MDVPIIFAVRKQSQRCPYKVVKPFYQNKSLIQVAAEKFSGDNLVYIAGHEDEFKKIAADFKINFIQRTLKSALSESLLEIHNYLLDIGYQYACLVNVCCPLLKTETVYKAIDHFKSNDDILSMFSVIESHDIIFNTDYKIVNSDKVFNSKIRKPNYIGSNAFIIFDIYRLFNEGSYWAYKFKDPYLFSTTKIEAIDIDTEEDFIIAQILYEKYYDQ